MTTPLSILETCEHEHVRLTPAQIDRLYAAVTDDNGMTDEERESAHYAQIARKLDQLEEEASALIIDALKESRESLLALVLRDFDPAKPQTAQRLTSTIELKKWAPVQYALGEMLRMAMQRGRQDIRRMPKMEAFESRIERNERVRRSVATMPRQAIAYARAKELFISGAMKDDLTKQVKAILLAALKTGEQVDVTVGKLRTMFDPFVGSENVSASRLATIVRTNTTEAYNHGVLVELRAVDAAMPGGILAIRYTAILDMKVTELCAGLNGTLFAINDPRLDALVPPNHWNAVTAGTAVETVHGPVAIEDVQIGDRVLTHRGRYRSVYAVMNKRGEKVLDLHLSTGRILRITDDHPVLTTAGWSRAGDLQIGNVLFQHGEQVPGAVDIGIHRPDDYPSLFDEPAVAWDHVCTSRRIPLLGIDLKGNLVIWKREVDYKSTNGMLEVDAGIGKHRQHERFVVGRLFPPRVGPPNRGLLGSAFSKIRIIFDHSCAAIAGPFARFFSHSVRPMIATAALGNHALIAVGDGNLLGSGSRGNAMTFAPSGKSRFTESHFALNETKRSALFEVPLSNEIENISSIAKLHDHALWTGASIIAAIKMRENCDVYNLAVEEDETYHAEGIVVHNCRSILEPVIDPTKVQNQARWIDKEMFEWAQSLMDPGFGGNKT